jgi:hypothetical protein
MSHGNKLAKHEVVSEFRLLSDFHCWLFSTADLNGSGKCEILQAGAFVNIYFISCCESRQLALHSLVHFLLSLIPLFLIGRITF